MSPDIAAIINEASTAQNRASNPGGSVWVSANAGSGKTRVLTDRVARLLLSGAEPQKILCLTFTKAAAAEMQSRLFKRLGGWAMLDDDALRKDLAAIGEAVYDDAALHRARTLFAAALETPGGLRIQTIHAFCAQLLRRFPLEAHVSPDFREMEEREAAFLRAEVVETLIERGDPNFDAFARFLTDEGALDQIYRDILKNRAGFGGFDRVEMARLFETDPDATHDALEKRAIARISISNAVAIAENFASHGGKRALGRLSGIKSFANAAPEERKLAALVQSFFNASGEPLNVGGWLTSADMKAAYPALVDHIEDIQTIVARALKQQSGLLTLNKAEALHNFAQVFLATYDAEKSARGVLDFDDLIVHAEALLTQSDMAQWVLFRLDGGIDHILVDEAQDTAPRQWSVVKALTEEFISGGGDADRARTLFVVGDKKQSIFGFQGADPDAFMVNRDRFADRLGGGMQDVDLLHSFRSAAPVLKLVDAVFAPSKDAMGDVPHHIALPDRPGRVEIWPFLEKEKNEEQARWWEPVDMTKASNPTRVLAAQVADRIARMIADGQTIPVRDATHQIVWRPVEPGDVMVLLRSRTGFFHTLIAELKARDVPVAGADRLILTEELAVMDVLSLLRFLDTELDDLSLAEALRSPLFGISEADLFRLAHGRGDRTLWEVLRDSDHADCVARLRILRNKVDFARPYELLEEVLIGQGGRAALMARLGPAAQDAIDELLHQALIFETTGTPSLSGFLAWILSGNVEVKREMSVAGGEVRVMTVHGSKGLEAPVVIVPDVADFRPERHKPAVTLAGDTALWSVPNDRAPPVMKDAETARRAAEEREYQRLLYVALTRAEAWLILCGAGSQPDKAERWYARCHRAMVERGAEAGPDGTLTVASDWQDTCAERDVSLPEPPPIPDWVHHPVSEARDSKATVTPSGLAEGLAHALPGEGADAARAMERGTRLHQLLEVLPAFPPDDWPARADVILADDPEAKAILDEARAILTAPDLAQLFSGDGLSEMPFCVPFGPDGTRLIGKIDRLCLSASTVHCIDFKSNRTVPTSADAVPEGILVQLGAYAHALRSLWPERALRISVLWTHGPVLMDIPHDRVTRSLADVTAP